MRKRRKSSFLTLNVERCVCGAPSYWIGHRFNACVRCPRAWMPMKITIDHSNPKGFIYNPGV